MLNTDLHNANIKPERKMKLNDFIRNLRGQLLLCDADFCATAATGILSLHSQFVNSYHKLPRSIEIV